MAPPFVLKMEELIFLFNVHFYNIYNIHINVLAYIIDYVYD